MKQNKKLNFLGISLTIATFALALGVGLGSANMVQAAPAAPPAAPSTSITADTPVTLSNILCSQNPDSTYNLTSPAGCWAPYNVPPIGSNTAPSDFGTISANGQTYFYVTSAANGDTKAEAMRQNIAAAGSNIISATTYIDSASSNQVTIVQGQTFTTYSDGQWATYPLMTYCGNPAGCDIRTMGSDMLMTTMTLSAGWNAYDAWCTNATDPCGYTNVSPLRTTSQWDNVQIAIASNGDFQYYLNGTLVWTNTADPEAIAGPIPFQEIILGNRDNSTTSFTSYFAGVGTQDAVVDTPINPNPTTPTPTPDTNSPDTGFNNEVASSSYTAVIAAAAMVTIAVTSALLIKRKSNR